MYIYVYIYIYIYIYIYTYRLIRMEKGSRLFENISATDFINFLSLCTFFHLIVYIYIYIYIYILCVYYNSICFITKVLNIIHKQ